jgi:hypothetical protein
MAFPPIFEPLGVLSIKLPKSIKNYKIICFLQNIRLGYQPPPPRIFYAEFKSNKIIPKMFT